VDFAFCPCQVRDTEPLNLAHVGELEHAGVYLSKRGYDRRRDRTVPRLVGLVPGLEQVKQRSEDSAR
jgi:hypothetical protein